MIITHKIRINPNNKQITQIKKSFGVARFTYNWILERYKQNYTDFSIFTLKHEFNAIKAKMYPFVREVSKYVTQTEFLNFKATQNSFRESIKNKHRITLHYKTKHDKKQVYYIGGDHARLLKKEGSNKDYLKLPKMPALKLTENLRYKGRITSVRVEQEYDRYYVAINVEIPEFSKKEVKKSEAIGIDMGIKHHLTLSNGLQIDYPNSIDKTVEIIKKAQKNLSRKVHPRAKGDKKVFSNNYLKCKSKLDRLYGKLKNIKIDYERKVAKLITQYYGYICLEDLTTITMFKNKNIARRLQNISFYRMRRFIEYKTKEYSSEVLFADKYYPSSKMCSYCGSMKQDLALNERTFVCPMCGQRIDRDLNAAINLKKIVGRVTSEFKPLDLEFLCDLKKLNINASKVE